MNPAVAFVLIALGVILIIIAIVLFIEGYKKQKANRLLKKGDRTTPTYVAVQRDRVAEFLSKRDRCAELLSKPDKESLEYAKKCGLSFLYNIFRTTQEDWDLLQTVLFYQNGICTETQMEGLLKFPSLLYIVPEKIVLWDEGRREQFTGRYIASPLYPAFWPILCCPYGTINELFEQQGKQAAERLFSLIEEVSKKEELRFYFRDEEENKEADIIYAEAKKELPEGEHLFENPFIGAALTDMYLYLYKSKLNQKLDEIYPKRKKERY